jgi:hypothetical protein
MLLALVFPAFAGLLINEVMYDPTGGDGEDIEWTELCNSGSTTIDLAGYEIWAAGSTPSKIATITSGTIPPRGYAVVSGPSPTVVATILGTMQNGGTTTDAVYLKSPGGSTVVDALFYDSPNSNNLVNETGFVATSFAVGVAEGHTLGRWPDCTDTNTSATDFSDYATPTRGIANVAPTSGGGGGGTTADCTGSADVLVNEFLADPSGSDTGNEWVEIYNAGRSSVNLAGWQLQWDTSSWTGASSFSVPAGTTLAAGGYLLIGAGGLTASLSLGNAGSSADGVRLACNSNAVDTVVYGTSNTDALTDDRGTAATSLAPKPASGQSLARLPNGTDTNASATDFSLSTSPTPGAANTSGGGGGTGSTADCTGAAGVKINEFTPDSGVEFVEIHNNGSTTVDLEGWEVAFGTSSYSRAAVVADGVRLAPGDYYVLGSAGAPTKDQTVEFDLGNASSNSDALRLECGDTVVDTVIYGKEGTPNEDGWDDDLVADTTSICVMPGDGESASRVQDGYDTDRSASDFVVGAPTPGAPNPRVEPPVCEANTGARIVMNEVLYDPDSTDADHEWIELYNAGNASTRLDGWSVETATSAWGEDFVFPSGVELAPGDFLVVGGSAVAEADQFAEDLSLGNGTRADGVRIVDCEGGVVDTVLYGDVLGDPITGDAGNTEVVTGVESAMSIGRYPDGADTNGMSDWKGYAAPSPGASNADPGGSSDTAGGSGDVPGGGCGDDAPEDGTRPDGGGCTTVPARVSFAGLLAMVSLVLVGRRKR